jgi:hypothetical protein
MPVGELNTPSMVLAVRLGVESSLGMPQGSVTVTHVGGVKVGSFGRRRLAISSASVTFEIKSLASDDSSVKALESNLALAATEGSLVANVQKSAHDMGVLTPALLAVPWKIPADSITTSTTQKTVTVVVPARPLTPLPYRTV